MSDPDELYTLRNRFWLGAYQLAISEGAGLSRLSSDALRIERDEYVFRSYIALGQAQLVVSEVKETAPVSLQAVKLLATYTSGGANAATSETAVLTLNEWLADPAHANNPSLKLVAAIVFMGEDHLKDALKAVRQGATLEHMALLTQIYLKMDRRDLAAKQLKAMQQADEDSTLTQLAGAWVHLATGGPKFQEAAYVYEELIDKFGATATLLNGLAAAHMHMGKYDEAEKFLVDAASKGANDADTLINLIACYSHLGKPGDFVQRYVAQLTLAHPAHPYVAALKTANGMFERASTGFAPSA